MKYKAGHERRQIKVERRGYKIEPFADVHWLVAGDIVSATAIYTDTGDGPQCTTAAIAHGEVGFDLHNSDNEATIQITTIMSGELLKWSKAKSEESLWTEAAIRLAFMALVEKLEEPSRLGDKSVHPWIAEGTANFDAIVKARKEKAE